MIVTIPSGVMRMKLLGTGITGGACWPCATADKGLRYKPSSMPPPPIAVTCRNDLRLIDVVFKRGLLTSLRNYGLVLEVEFGAAPAALWIASRMRRYVPQRQRLP